MLDLLLRLSGSEVPACVELYRRLEEAPPAVVDEYQRLMLLRLLRHCRVHVPRYRVLLEEHGLDLSDHFTPRELSKLPLLTKNDLRAHRSDLVSDDAKARKPFWNSSGGSTGSPVAFLQDRAYRDRNVIAAKLLYNEILGKLPGDREINLWGSADDLRRGTVGPRARLVNFFYNRRFLNCFRVSDDTLARHVREINRFRPVSLWAYAQSLELLAKFVQRTGVSVHSPQLVVSTASPLHDDVRRLVHEVFRCPVYDQYGCREAGAIAFETAERGGLRGLPYLNYVELVDGRIVVTPLTNYSMPLLRYELGDTAEPWTGPQDTRYGCRRRLFASVTGRMHSHFRTAAGELVHGGYFARQFFFRTWIRQFQVVQDALEHVTCHIVAADEPGPGELADIRRGIRAAMGPRCEVEFRFTDEIRPPPSGKHQYTICNL
ncbi:MAG TPA: hypothetical protein VKZ85_03630 [Woeseiaceae bacterium]|nr:hypothetical protein [Woeseiaceae bacterium]